MRSKERRVDLWRRPSLMTDLDSTIRWGLLWKYASGPSSKWITSLYFPSKGPTYMVQLVHEFRHFARYISQKKNQIRSPHAPPFGGHSHGQRSRVRTRSFSLSFWWIKFFFDFGFVLWYVANISIIFWWSMLVLYQLLYVLFTLYGIFMYFLELTY
jgi:hypothetical protein